MMKHIVFFIFIFAIIISLNKGIPALAEDTVKPDSPLQGAEDVKPVSPDVPAEKTGNVAPAVIETQQPSVAPADVNPEEKKNSDAAEAAPGADKKNWKLMPSWLALGAYAQMQYIYEKAQNDKRQGQTADPGVDSASGFNLKRARISLDAKKQLENTPVEFGARFLLRLETQNPSLLDCFGFLSLYSGMADLWLGQMKIPSTYEVGIADTALDFTSPGLLSSMMTDLALTRSMLVTSTMYNSSLNMRDMGAALKGEVYGFSYFFMMGNGLGCSRYVGNRENPQYIHANGIGAHLYGIRGSVDFMKTLKELDIPTGGSINPVNSFSVGGHYTHNKHDGMILQDNTVVDIKRQSWSTDIRVVVDLPIPVCNRIRLTGMLGGGDNHDTDASGIGYDYDYWGYEVKGIIEILRDRLDIGVRYDTYTYDYSIHGGGETLYNITTGMGWRYDDLFRVQCDYKWKHSNEKIEPDINDNILTIQAQFNI